MLLKEREAMLANTKEAQEKVSALEFKVLEVASLVGVGVCRQHLYPDEMEIYNFFI